MIALISAHISLAAFITLVAVGVVLGFCIARLYYAAKIEGTDNGGDEHADRPG